MVDKKNILRFIGMGILFFALLWVLEKLEDATGIDTVMSRWSQDQFYRIAGANKGINDMLYSTDAQDKITTVVIDDKEDLPSFGITWPVSYGVHADILQSIAEKKPKAIFVDILFADAREDPSILGLSNVVCEIVASGVPVFLASATPFEARGGIREELSKCASVVSAKAPANMDDGVLRSYDLVLSESGKSVPSAAFAMYSAYKQSTGQGKLDPAQFQSEMQIFWGKQAAPLNRKWMACNDPTLFDSFSVDSETSRSSCPYTQTLAARHLLEERYARDEDVRTAIEGKLVIYGASITGAGDIIRSPAHYELAGLYGHAMALDNLLTFDTGYKTAAPEWLDAVVQWILIVVYLLLWETQKGRELTDSVKLKDGWEAFFSKAGAYKIARLSVIPVIILIGIWSLYHFWNIAPLNWVKFLGLVFIADRLAQLEGLKNFLVKAVLWVKEKTVQLFSQSA